MPIDAGTAELEVEANLDRAARKLDDDVPGVFGKAGDKAHHSFMGSFGKLAVSIGGLFAGVQAFSFAKGTIDAASDLGESLSKVNVVFGENATAIEDWSKSSAMSLGISQQTALEAAGTFGNLFSAMKLPPGATKEMSTGIVGLASDLASFNNANPEDVLLALRSGLVGEAEPLRQFGINLSAARIEDEAMRMGLAKSKDELTAGAKAQAAYSLIMQDTTLAQGDFARTADGAANKSRILSARFTDFKATIGKFLLPAFQAALDLGLELVGGFTAFIAAFKAGDGEITSSGLAGWFEELGYQARLAFEWIRDNVVPVLIGIGHVIVEQLVPALISLAGWLIDSIGYIIEHQPLLIGVAAGIAAVLVVAFINWAIAAGLAAVATIAAAAPFIALALVVAAFVAGIIWAYQNVEVFRVVIDAVASFLRDVLWPVIQAVASFIIDVFVVHIQALVIAFDVLRAIIEVVVGWARDHLGPAFDDVQLAVMALWNWIGFLRDIFQTGFEAIEAIVRRVADFVVDRINDVVGPARDLYDTLKGITDIGGWNVGGVGGSKHLLDVEPEHRAMGGRVRSRSPYFVGEDGIELFVPDTAGTIVPNSQVDGGRHYHLTTSTLSTEADIMTQFRRMELIGDYAVVG